MQSRRLALIAAVAFAVTLAAAPQSDEQTFIKEAVQSNLTEVQLGELRFKLWDGFLAHAYAGARALRIADGPDEVHLASLAKGMLR